MRNSLALSLKPLFVCVLGVALGLLINKTASIFAANPIFLLALPIFGLLLVVFALHPKWSLAVMLVSRPLLDNLLENTKMSFGDASIGFGAGINLLVLLLTSLLLIRENNFPTRQKITVYWLMFLAILFAATLYSPYLSRAVRLYANYWTYFAMYLVPFFLIKNRNDFVFWSKVLVSAFVLPVAFAGIDLLQGGEIYADAGLRIRGTFTHPNILAFFLVLGIAVTFYATRMEIMKKGSKAQLGLTLLLLSMTVLLFATKTRNAWTACFFFFFLYGLLKERKTLLFLTLGCFLAMLVPQIHTRVFEIFSPEKLTAYDGVNSFAWRMEIWKSSLPLIAAQPLQGYGLTSFMPMSLDFFSSHAKMGAHNLYLEMLFEAGIVGLTSIAALFLVVLCSFVTRIARTQSLLESRGLTVAFCYFASYMLTCTADNLGYYLVLNWYVWFFIGLVNRYSDLKK